MNICLFTSDEINKPLSLKDERSNHLLKILHKKEGDTFDAGIIGGNAGIATISKITENELYFSFEAKSSGKKLFPLTLIVGFPRPIQLKRLLRDVAGLGVKKVILCGTELTEKSYLDSNVIKDGSAQKMLLDGTVQAASTHVPELVVSKSLKEAIKEAVPQNSNYSIPYNVSSLIALDNKKMTVSLHEFLQKESSTSFVAAIGSERGWTDNEREILLETGFTLCSMGNRVLRTETAATVACSIILDSAGFLN